MFRCTHGHIGGGSDSSLALTLYSSRPNSRSHQHPNPDLLLHTHHWPSVPFDTDLDVYVPKRHLELVATWLMDKAGRGYEFKAAPNQPVNVLEAIASHMEGDMDHPYKFGVFRFVSTRFPEGAKATTVELITGRGSPMDAVTTFHSS